MAAKNSRTSGFTFPPHPFQILSWFLYILFVVTFYTLFILFPSTDGQISSGVLFTFFAIITCASNISATTTNPADPRIYQPLKNSPRDAVSGHLYCYRCERHVLESSKHCTVCQKCIDVFDHHCIWLNNCVGKHNYIQFLLLLISAALMLVIEIAIGIAILVDYATHQDSLDEHVRTYYPSLSGTAYFVITIILSIFAIVGVGAIIQLLAFHISLIYHNMTTYEFIMSRVQGWRETPSSPSNNRNNPANLTNERKGSGSAFSAATHDLRTTWSRKESPASTATSSSSIPNTVTDIELTKGSGTSITKDGEEERKKYIPIIKTVSNPDSSTGSSSDYFPSNQNTITVPTTELPAMESSSNENKHPIHSTSAISDDRTVRITTNTAPSSPYRSLSNNGNLSSSSSSRSTSPTNYPTAIELITNLNSNRKTNTTTSSRSSSQSVSPTPGSQHVPNVPVPLVPLSSTSTPNASASEGGPSENEDEQTTSSPIPQRSIRSSMVDLEVGITNLTNSSTTITKNNNDNNTVANEVSIPVSSNTSTEGKETETEESKNTNDNEHITIVVSSKPENVGVPTEPIEGGENMINNNAQEEVNSSVLCSPLSTENTWEPSQIPRGTRIAPLASDVTTDTESKEGNTKRENERKDDDE